VSKKKSGSSSRPSRMAKKPLPRARTKASDDAATPVKNSSRRPGSDTEAVDFAAFSSKKRSMFCSSSLAKVPEWKLGAESGNARSAVLYGLALCFGHGVDENDDLAVKWFTRASDAGVAEGQVRLGECFLQGIGVKQSYKRAFAYFMAAAEQGYGRGSRRVADLLYYGDGVVCDEIKALDYYCAAGDQGESAGLEVLGRRYLGKKNDQFSADWLFRKKCGIDLKRAVDLFVKAYKRRHDSMDSYRLGSHIVGAAFWLENCYRNGLGVSQDRTLADRWQARYKEFYIERHGVGEWEAQYEDEDAREAQYEDEKAHYEDEEVDDDDDEDDDV